MNTRLLVLIIGVVVAIAVVSFIFLGREDMVEVTELPDNVEQDYTRPVVEIPVARLQNKEGGYLEAPALLYQPGIKELSEGFYSLAEDETGFDVMYFHESGSLTVTIYEEPLAEQRKQAEAVIRSATGYGDETICDLNAKVTTNQYVNPYFAGLELGFSFCPGSVALE